MKKAKPLTVQQVQEITDLAKILEITPIELEAMEANNKIKCERTARGIRIFVKTDPKIVIRIVGKHYQVWQAG